MKRFLPVLVLAAVACSPTPNTLTEAGLASKTNWTNDDYRLAARILVKQTEKSLPALNEAVRRGDVMAGIDVALGVVKAAGEWPSDLFAEANIWRPCRLSIAYMIQYAETGGNKRFFEENLAACKKQL